MRFIKNKKFMIFSVLLSLLLIIVTASIASANSQDFNTELDSAVLRDAKVYAEYEGVTVQEAIYRFHLIEIAGPLHSELYSKEVDTFGDGWIENGPQFKIVVQFTQNGKQTMQPYLLKYPELVPYIEIRQANISYRDLTEEQAKLMSELNSIGISADSQTDIKTGCIKLFVVNEGILTQEIGNGVLSLPDNVEIIPVSRLAQYHTDVIGGHEISSEWEDPLTTGFGAVVDSTRVITTAGHFAHPYYCDAEYDDSIDLYYYDTPYSYGHDIAWYEPEDGYDVTNRIQDSESTTRGILYVEDYDDIWIDEYIFKYGISTQNTVGQVSSKTYSHLVYSWYVRVEPISGDMSAPGDSGAPCYRSNIAIGSLVGHPADNNDDMYFYPISKLSEWNVDVLTES